MSLLFPHSSPVEVMELSLAVRNRLPSSFFAFVGTFPPLVGWFVLFNVWRNSSLVHPYTSALRKPCRGTVID